MLGAREAEPSPARLSNLNPSATISRTAPINFVFWTTCLLLISHFSRIFERVLVGAHVPAVICSVGIVAMLVSGALKRLNSSIGFVVLIYISWMMACTPFSTWKGGSAQYVLWYAAFWVVLMLLIAQAPHSTRDIIRLAGVTLASCLFFLIAGSQMTFGRLGADTTFGNSDDVALMGGFALAFALMVGLSLRKVVLRFFFLAATCGYLLITIGRTGTRTAVLALLGMLGVFFLRSGTAHKVLLIVASVLMFVALLFVLPESTLQRFGTIFDSMDAESVALQASTSEAMASTAERRDLFADAVQMTRENPIFGVGPGEYMDYRFNFLRDAFGRPKRFFPSHNTYAQIAAESGIPGLLLYLFFLIAIYRTILRIRRLAVLTNHPDAPTMKVIALCLEANLVYFAICAGFMTCDRHPHQFVIAGMALAGERLLKHWMEQQPARPMPLSQPAPGNFQGLFPTPAIR